MDGPVGTEDSSAKATNRTTRPQGTELHSHAWHIQRLLFIAAEKESTPECPMASMNKFPAAPFVLIVTNFLCTPPHIFSHPLASQGAGCASHLCAMSVMGKGELVLVEAATSGRFVEEVVFFHAVMRKEVFAKIVHHP